MPIATRTPWKCSSRVCAARSVRTGSKPCAVLAIEWSRPMPNSALRRRLVIGSVFWTLGLFALTGVALTHVMYSHPHARTSFHSIFSNAWYMSAIGVALLLAGVWSVRRGVSAISQLRTRLGDVHAGREKRLVGQYPAEV